MQKQVANHLGFTSTDRISLWERGLAYPSVPNFIQLLELYKVTPDEIYPRKTN